MKTRQTIAAGLVALGIAGLITAQRSADQEAQINPNDSGFIGSVSEQGATAGIWRVPEGSLIPLSNILVVDINLNITGRRNVMGCVGGNTPPNCTYSWSRPATGRPCLEWQGHLGDSFSSGDCSLLGNPFYINWWMSAPDGTWNNPRPVGRTRVVPQLVDPASCKYRFSTTADVTLPKCEATPTPTPTPTATPIPSPTMPPSPTPITCSAGYHYCAPQWYYGGPECGWYWTRPNCCPEGYRCQIHFYWYTCYNMGCCNDQGCDSEAGFKTYEEIAKEQKSLTQIPESP